MDWTPVQNDTDTRYNAELRADPSARSGIASDVPPRRLAQAQIGSVLPPVDLFSGGYTGSTTLTYADLMREPLSYREEVQQCRFFARYDPVAASVISRMIELAARPIQHHGERVTAFEYEFFTAVADVFLRSLPSLLYDFLVNGFAVPSYTLQQLPFSRIRGTSKRKVWFPVDIWLYNVDSIRLRRAPAGSDIYVYYVISDRDKWFILNEGTFPDGKQDKELYRQIVQSYPEYVRLIQSGVTEVRLETWPVVRMMPSFAEYPTPFLLPALSALKRRLRLRAVDDNITMRALNAFLHVKAGNDRFPVTDGDTTLEDLRTQLQQRSVIPTRHGPVSDHIAMLFTNHTVELSWVYPPFDPLLTTEHHSTIIDEILLALGFSRILLVGETMRSNAGANRSTIGTIASLLFAQQAVLGWLERFYHLLAELNGFRTYPKPMFVQTPTADVLQFFQFLLSLYKEGAIDATTVRSYVGLTSSAATNTVPSTSDASFAEQTTYAEEDTPCQPSTLPT